MYSIVFMKNVFIRFKCNYYQSCLSLCINCMFDYQYNLMQTTNRKPYLSNAFSIIILRFNGRIDN